MLDVVLEEYSPILRSWVNCVSILVVLDVVLEVPNSYRKRLCFGVSILVVLDVVLEAAYRSAEFTISKVFQSLLCWM